VGIGHERAGDGDGELAGAGHLVDGLGFKAVAPLLPRGRGGGDGFGRAKEGFGKFAAQGVGGEVGRGVDDGGEFGGELGFVAALKDEVGDEFHATPGAFTGRDAESDEVFGVHGSSVGVRRVA